MSIQRFDLVKLHQVASINYGYTESASSDKIGPKFLRITDIQDGKVNWETVPYCKIDDSDFAKHKLEVGDIVFARTGATTGKSFLIQEPPASVPASYLIRLRLTDARLLPDFLALFFQTSSYWEAIHQGSSGSAQGGFNASKLKELEIPLPPLEEQKRIAAVLDKAFAALDRARALAQANLADAKELAHQTTDLALGRLGKAERIGGHVDLLSGFAFKSGGYTERETDVRLIRGDNIVQGAFRWTGVKRWPISERGEYEKYELALDDVLIAMDRTWISTGIKYAVVDDSAVPSLLVQRVARLRTKATLLPKYLAICIGSKRFEKYVLSIQAGLGVPHVSGKQIESFEVPVPPMTEQVKTVARIAKIRDGCSALVAATQGKLNDIDDLRQSLLQKAFAGELT